MSFFLGDDDEPTINLDTPEGMWGSPLIWRSYVVFSYDAAIDYGFPYAVSLTCEQTDDTIPR